jgi:flagellar hook-basal body complex protein FliE
VDIKEIKLTAEAVKPLLGNAGLKSPLLDEFNTVFKEATAAMANTSTNDWLIKEKKKVTAAQDSISLDKIDKSSVAQMAQGGVVQNSANAIPKDINIVPLQIFLDNAIRSLENVSRQEFKMNELIDQFVEGKVSEDEVVLETAKLNLSISMITTIVQSAVQTFKEIQNIPV